MLYSHTPRTSYEVSENKSCAIAHTISFIFLIFEGTKWSKIKNINKKDMHDSAYHFLLHNANAGFAH